LEFHLVRGWKVVCYVYMLQFINHSSLDGHLACFHFLVTLNSALMNLAVQMSLQNADFISFGCIPKSEIYSHMVDLFLYFWGNIHSGWTHLHSYQQSVKLHFSFWHSKGKWDKLPNFGERSNITNILFFSLVIIGAC
jgi:hypothetical protein